MNASMQLCVLDNFIQNNKKNLIDSLNISNIEQYYKFLKNTLFDNLPFLIFIYLYLFPRMFKIQGQNRQFNSSMIIIIPLVIFMYIIIKGFYRKYSKIGNILRTHDNLDIINKIIINKTIKPIELKSDLLLKPFNEFFVNTSHNTYIPCTQNMDVASLDAIKCALAMGARVIELDCFAKNNRGYTDDDMTPIVTHGVERKLGDYFTTSYLLFEDCINTIVEYGFLTSDPLIICLELNTNKLSSVQRNMKNIILQKLGDRLLDSSYKISNKNNRKIFINEPIKNLLNKVIFITGDGYTEELMDIIDGTFSIDEFLNNKNNLNMDLCNPIESGVIQRIFPAGNIYGHLSYNFDPTVFWKNKCQLVAMNFQKIDDNLLKNLAMFKTNSYVHFNEISY